jgi:hypothetical protein
MTSRRISDALLKLCNGRDDNRCVSTYCGVVAVQKPVTTTVVLCACLAGAAVRLDGNQALTVRVTPTMAREPASVKVLAVIEADDRNRSLEVIVRSSDYFRSSQFQLDGHDTQRVWEIEFRNVPQGNYEVTGILTGTEGRRAAVTRVVVVMP